MSEHEISETIYSEGWHLKLLHYHERKNLAVLLLDKFKVINEDTQPKLEIYTFPEIKMLKISIYYDKKDIVEVGNIEINTHTTLSDVRIMIKHEFDPMEIPKTFRFLYKNIQCSVKQETFRKVWDILPILYIVPKIINTYENTTETDDIIRKREKIIKKEIIDIPLLQKGQRRIFGKFAVIPVLTLAYIREGSSDMYLLHSANTVLNTGDIIRIGNILSRDYIIMPQNDKIKLKYPNSVKIGPVYDLIEEADFSIPIMQNYAYPKKNAGKYYDINLDFSYSILKNPLELGYDYIIPNPEDEVLEEEGENEGENNSTTTSIKNNLLPISGKVMSVSSTKTSQKTSLRPLNQTFSYCWIWKCIPYKDDIRPKWRVLYDNGSVPYQYTYRNNNTDYFTHFRIRSYYNYLEVLCTDSRIPEFTIYPQRIDDMYTIPIEYYTEYIFNKMTDWAPSYKKGIEKSKFIKLIKEVNGFPDLKRSARIAQLEMYFMKILKSEYGIVQKYINYAGFCQLLKDVALIRFPPPRRQYKDTNVGGDDHLSIGSLDENASIASLGSLGEGSVGSLGSHEKKSITSQTTTGNNSEISNNNIQNQNIGGKKKKSTTTTASYATRKSKRRKLESENNDDNSIDNNSTSIIDIDPIYILTVYKKFIIEYIMMYPDWYNAIWEHSKYLAMKRAALPYCAATRIIAIIRGKQARKRYLYFLYTHIKLQANIRRKLSYKKTLKIIYLLNEDWCLRMRYNYVLLIQKLIRKYLKRCWYYHVIDKIKKQEFAVQKAKRFRLKKLKLQAKKGILYKELKRINGVMVFIRLTRQDTRNYTKDCSLIIEVYIPIHQITFKFPLEDSELRFYMQLELNVEVCNMGDLLDKRNLQRLVASRLMIHKPNSKFSTIHVIFSKHGLGQRGKCILTKGKIIKKELFICKLYETGDNISIQCYHRYTCKIYNITITIKELNEWIHSEHQRIHSNNEILKYSQPFILQQNNKKDYYNWIIDHITIDTRNNKFNVIFLLHLFKSKKNEMLIKIQSVWRKVLNKPKIIKLLDDIYIKVKINAYDHTVYYLNKLNGTTNWNKTKLLGNSDLTKLPQYEWIEFNYYDNITKTYKIHYVNPYNGLYTKLIPNQAAKIIQSLVRNFLLKAIKMPFLHFIKAGKIYKNAEHQYYSPHKKLAAVINYAMILHLIKLDEILAKKIYSEAVELSEANPLVTRAWGFYMLGTCEAPIKLNRDRAIMLFADAERKDPTHDKFQIAYYLYQFSCICYPKNINCLINLALVQCILYNNNYSAEKLLRRALAIAPFEERVMEIWNYLKDRFPDRQMIYNPNSRVHKVNIPKDGKTRMIHGRPVKENTQWAGWVYVEKDTFHISKKYKAEESYWYNPADGTEQLDPPDFDAEWMIRRARSDFEGERYGLENYYDPLTSEYFQYHPLTKTFA